MHFHDDLDERQIVVVTRTPTEPPRTPHRPLAVGALIALVGAKLLLHVLLLDRYGYFRDELYFLDCARHLDWGYVDHAPLIALFAKLALLLGGSLPVVRLMPALAGAGLLALTIVLTRSLGGGRVAQALAGLAMLVAPVYLLSSSLLTMNVFEMLLVTGAFAVLVRIIRTGHRRLWLAFGVLAGIGLQNKHSMLFFGAAVVLALLVTEQRRQLLSPWLWLAGIVALLIFVPNLIWQSNHGFPTLEDLYNVRASGKNVELPPLRFLLQQVLMVHPVTLPIWACGVWFFLVGRGRAYRPIGVAFLILLVAFMAMHGKDYYLAPAYPAMLAGGATFLAYWFRRIRWRALKVTVLVLVFGVVGGAGALTAPLALPLLSPERYVAYREKLGVEPQKAEVAHEGPLPQPLGDQFGWPELVAEIARVFHTLPEDERSKACIWTSNYGEAGAVNLFGPRWGLPKATCAHQTHFLWGPGGCTGEVVIVTQVSRRTLERYFESVEEVGRHQHRWGMAEENRPIFLCRRLRMPVAEWWQKIKHWN
jgi:hypothetical protein